MLRFSFPRGRDLGCGGILFPDLLLLGGDSTVKLIWVMITLAAVANCGQP